MSESTAPHPIYNPDEYTRSDEPAPAPHTQPTQPPSQCPAGELPARWIVGLYGCNTGSASNVTVDIEGLRVMVSVVRHTADMQQISAVYLQLRTVVHRYTHVRAGISVIAPDLPPQVASARWRTPAGEVTLIRPRPGTHRCRKRLGGRFLGLAPLIPVAAWAHKASTGLRGAGGAVATVAGVATIASVTAMTAAPPARPAPTLPHPSRSYQVDMLDVPPAVRPTASPPQPAAAPPVTTPTASPQTTTSPPATVQATDGPPATSTPTTSTPTTSTTPSATATPKKPKKAKKTQAPAPMDPTKKAKKPKKKAKVKPAPPAVPPAQP